MTRRQQAPSGQVKWFWIAALSVPAGMAAFVEKCSGTALVFTLKKFIEDPQAIVALTSLNILFGILVAPIVAWQSDRLHTRWGRRRPFMIPGLMLLAVCLVLLPQAQSLGWVIAILVVYQFSMDFGFTGLWKPLYADLVPDEQRGRGMVMNRAMAMAMRMVFMLFLIGRFDQHYGGGKGHGGGHGVGKAAQAMESVRWAGLTGEQVIYYSGAALAVLAIVFLIFFARESVETVTESTPRERFHVKRYLGQLFGSPRLRRLYLWVIAATPHEHQARFAASLVGDRAVRLFQTDDGQHPHGQHDRQWPDHPAPGRVPGGSCEPTAALLRLSALFHPASADILELRAFYLSRARPTCGHRLSRGGRCLRPPGPDRPVALALSIPGLD